METEAKKAFKPYFLIAILVPAIASAVEIYITQNSITGAFRNAIVIMILSFIMVYVLRDELNPRGVLLLTFFALISSAQAFLPDLILPIASLAVIMCFFVSPNTGISSVILFSTMPYLVTDHSFEYFLFYTATGIIAVTLMYTKRKTGKYVEVLVVFMLIYIMLYTALIILKRMSINADIIILPAVGLILDLVIMKVAGYRYYTNVEKKKEELYKRIVDPEYPLLMRLKKENRKEYKTAIHTAHFTELFAQKFGYDKVIMKGLGFYHRIGVLEGDRTSLAFRTVKTATYEGFPEELVGYLKEYGEVDGKSRVSPEVSICLITHHVISGLIKEYSKDKDADVDMNQFVDKVILKLFSGGGALLKHSLIPYDDLEQIRKTFKEEKIYYDFLR